MKACLILIQLDKGYLELQAIKAYPTVIVFLRNNSGGYFELLVLSHQQMRAPHTYRSCPTLPVLSLDLHLSFL